MARPEPDDSVEKKCLDAGHRLVAGVDEVGRGPMAGPVTAAAVILDTAHLPKGIADSKTLSPAKRRALADELMEHAQVSVAHASVEEIERLNVGQASLLAMTRAVAGLPIVPDHVLIDGRFVPTALKDKATAIPKGDQTSVSIAAASIVAKVTRDALMVKLAEEFPGYGWEKNAGYITPAHKKALSDLGVTQHHRKSFAPVRKALAELS